MAIAEAIEEAADRTVPSVKECLSVPGQKKDGCMENTPESHLTL